MRERRRRYRCTCFLDDEHLLAVARDDSNDGMLTQLVHLSTGSITHKFDVPISNVANVDPHHRQPYAFAGHLCGERGITGQVSHAGASMTDDGTATGESICVATRWRK